MSAADFPVSVTGTQLFVVAVAAIVVVGVSPGILSNALSVGPSELAPPGADDAHGPTAEIEVTAADPPNVRSADGTVGVVAGQLTGSVTLTQPVSSVDLVVHSRLPNGSWVVVQRATVEPAPAQTIDLSEALDGPRLTYLDRDQSNGFDVGVPGSTAHREGAVSVTAQVFVDGEAVDSVTDADSYGFLIDRPAATTVGDGASGSESAGDESTTESSSTTESGVPTADGPTVSGGSGFGSGAGNVPSGGIEGGESESRDEETDRRTLLFGAENAVPGSTGADSVTVSNPADEAVTATFALGAPIDEENGVTEPESAVDDTPDTGELSEHLAVRIWIETDDGETRPLIGGGEYIPLADAAGASQSLDLDPDEAVTVTVEWRIDSDVSNEIQSDSTTLSVHGTFQSTTTLSSSISIW